MHFFFDIIIIFVCLYYLSLFCVLVLRKGVCRKFGIPPSFMPHQMMRKIVWKIFRTLLISINLPLIDRQL